MLNGTWEMPPKVACGLHMQVHRHGCTLTSTYASTQDITHMHTHMHIHAHMHTCTHTRTHTQMHTYTHRHGIENILTYYEWTKKYIMHKEEKLGGKANLRNSENRGNK